MRRDAPQKFLSFYSKIAHTAYKNLICAYAQTLNFRMRQCINVQKIFCVSENLYAQRIKKSLLVTTFDNVFAHSAKCQRLPKTETVILKH